MISKSTTTGHEMTWVLFDNADATMMLVKKKNNGPRRKSAARDLQAANEDAPAALQLPSPSPPNLINPPSCVPQIQTHGNDLPLEPPPPYSPRQECKCDHRSPKPSATAIPLSAPRIPPPLPPRAPVRGHPTEKSPNALQLGKSCPDLARLVAKSVKNVKDSMNQEQERKAMSKSLRDVKDPQKSGFGTQAIAKSTSNNNNGQDQKIGKKPMAETPPSETKGSGQERDKKTLTKAIRSVTDDLRQEFNQQATATKASSPETGLEELISTKLDTVLTSIDGEAFSGDEKELDIYDRQPALRGGWGSASRVSQGANRAISSTIIGINYFKKANLYANSKLPLNLPALRLVYTKPAGKERETHVDANWKMGTKAMVIKSVPVDDMNTIVFAIRGSQTFMDWAVNLNSAPVSPGDFLDDSGNLCHSGFLSVARKMIRPVASRLRSLLEEDPSRSSCSLLMTGHSAGGAVASLLYAHMLATELKSELNILTGCFKRIHCITFGAPPVSLLPLSKPTIPRLKKSLFLSFINEGDPVPRADKAYIRSLLDLYTSPAPSLPRAAVASHKCALGFVRPKASRANSAPATLLPPSPPSPPQQQQQYVWAVPPGALSNAGRLVVLRGEKVTKDNLDNDVKAEITTDQQLREVVFGDPVMHMMKVYARRIEVLATKAVTAKVWG
ncbi:MAG: hypothetical protein Q9195_002175 [Heterodermia aff. obscurata]